jgi:hypothetical protein
MLTPTCRAQIITDFASLRTSWQQTTGNSKVISRVTSNVARAFEQSNKEVSSAVENNAALPQTHICSVTSTKLCFYLTRLINDSIREVANLIRLQGTT